MTDSKFLDFDIETLSNRREVGHGVKGRRNAPLPRWRRQGSKGSGTPLVDGVWGERSLPDGV